MKFYFWCGLVLFTASLLLMLPNFEDLKVARNGALVNMRIEKLPTSCLGTRIKHFMTVSYNSKLYTKRIGGKYCEEHHVGEVVQMKFLAGSTLVLFPNESGMSNLIALIILGLSGLALMIYWQIKR
ncbi:hypothetical protein AB6805_16790 [Chitinophaga sp. RCC_12]|uniref:hypothetical protein n=1 Tax=Chitinophaga sp. RCC_12 TaxID=3239226 RepID=UPI00352372A0